MFGLGMPELIVIFIIALIVFGPKKLPELGRSVGRAMAEFKKASQEFQDSVRAEMQEVQKNAHFDEIKQIGHDLAADIRKKPEEPQQEIKAPEVKAEEETEAHDEHHA